MGVNVGVTLLAWICMCGLCVRWVGQEWGGVCVGVDVWLGRDNGVVR